MTDYLDQLIELAIAKGKNWRDSDCPVVRTYRKETEPAWKDALSYSKLTEDQLFEKCRLAIQAQSIFRRDERSSGGKPAQPKMLSAWLRAGRWEEEIPSHADLKQKYESKFCFCGRETHGPKFSFCAEHLQLDEHGRFRDVLMAPEIREYYRKHPEIHGLTGRDAAQWIAKMRIK